MSILDGMGYSPVTEGNAVFHAHKPVFDRLFANNHNTLIEASGPWVGLPKGQMGNSEVWHLNLGAGRIVYQELQRINVAIRTGEFQKNEVLLSAIEYARSNNKPLHLLGLVSPSF